MAAVMQYGVLASAATTTGQVVCSTGLSAATTFKIMTIGAALTVYSATESNLGLGYIEAELTTGWVTKFEQRFQNTDLDNNCGMSILPLGSGISFTTAQQLRATCTPGAVTAMRWNASLWGNS